MLRDVSFDGVLKKYSTKYKADINDVVTTFTIQHVSMYDSQNFLDAYAKKYELENITPLFYEPVHWHNITLSADQILDLDFDGIQIDGVRLKEIKVRRKYNKKSMCDHFTYDLVFEQTSAQDNDRTFSACLNAKEEDADSGKKKLIQYAVNLDAVVETTDSASE